MEYNFTSTISAGNDAIITTFEELNKKSSQPFEVTLASYRYNHSDSYAKRGSNHYVIEHKNRNFNSYQLASWHNNKLILEFDKYMQLMEEMQRKRFDDVLYINTLIDGTTYIFKLNNMLLNFDYIECVSSTCRYNQRKKRKLVCLLDISSALKVQI